MKFFILFSALLFLSVTPLYSMGFIYKVVKAAKSKHAAMGASRQKKPTIEEEVRSAFTATGLPSVLLPLVLEYCSGDELTLLRTITLPDAVSEYGDYNRTLKYPKHSAINISFEDSSTLSVLDTNNQRLFYHLPEGTLIFKKSGKVPDSHFSPNHYDSSVFIADELISDDASNDFYKATIVGTMRDLRSRKNNIMGRCQRGGEMVRGSYYYDDKALIDPDQLQSRTTIEIYKKSGGSALASILGIALPQSRDGENRDASQKEERC